MRTERPTHEYRKLGALLGLGTCVIALLTYEMCISTQVGSAPGQTAQVMAAGSRLPEITSAWNGNETHGLCSRAPTATRIVRR